MTTEKEQLEAEIAKRDARIAELEAANAQLNTSRLSALQDCKARWTERDAALQELAALKSKQYGAGVVDERAAFESACEAVNERGWSTSTDLAWKIWGIARRLNLCHVSDGDDRGHDTRGSRKALGAVNAKLRAKVGRLDRELAALKAQQPSAGVVLPTVEQITEALDDVTCFHDLSAELIAPALLENLRAMIGSTHAGSGVVLPERKPEVFGGEYAGAAGWNDCINEVARLNPCRAQAVPDGYVLVPGDGLKRVHRDLDACQRVIWLGLRGADPAYCADAQARLADIDSWLASAQGNHILIEIAKRERP